MDGELDLVRSLEVEQHLQGCADCSRAVDRHRALRTALAEPALYHRSPAGLRERIRSALAPAAEARAARRLRWRWPLGLAAASVALAALLTWGAVRVLSVPSAEDLLAQQVFASHMRSLVANTPWDKESDDKHTIKPWLNGRVDYAPPVGNFAGQGFSLAGARVDYLDNRKVACLVYWRHKHVINLFVWQSAAPDSPPHVREHNGYHLIHWTHAGQTFWAVSDLNEQELQQFVQLVREA
jgi:anti-sigma factor RsiW